MNEFQKYLDKIGEVGYVEEVAASIVYASGLPSAKPNEIVLFETGEFGQVLSLSKEYAEILLFSKIPAKVGSKIARTDRLVEVEVGSHLFGKTVNSLGQYHGQETTKKDPKSEMRPINVSPLPIADRKNIEKPLPTGVSIVDLVVPLAKGQRELIIGDRKSGKTSFLNQVLLAQAKAGTLCIYAAVAKKSLVVARIQEFIKKSKIEENSIIVAASTSVSSAAIFLAPYTAMTIAEYFRDQGRDVLVIVDDLTAHAKYYREVTLLAKRFPGRSSYPGDIFYAHARLLERAGNFQKGSITCLPVAETVMGDISGYIQTNLMSMTDGHIYFDIDLANLGRRPSVNAFLSVTRVGAQPQTPLLRDASRTLSSYLVHYRRLRGFMHFGAELTEKVQREIAMGDRVIAMFEQLPHVIVPINVNLAIFGGVWAGLWSAVEIEKMRGDMAGLVDKYQKDAKYKEALDKLISSHATFDDLVRKIKQQNAIVKT